jgi:outer membrane immunogenic protein
MKRTIWAISFAAAAGACGTAGAADMVRGPQPYYSPTQPSVYNWSGLYAGANVGYEWGKVPGTNTEPSGIAGGLQAGYNWQSGQFVFGAEADIQASGAEDTFAPYKFSNPWFGTLRGRAGVALNNILFYGTGGLAYGGLTGELAGLDESQTHVGWTVGAGMEVGFNRNWSAKAEYLYMDLSDRGYTITGTNNGLESSLLRFGINYRF